MNTVDLIKAIVNSSSEETKQFSNVSNLPFKVGETWFFRTVTHHQTGRIKAIYGKFVMLEDAAWIADSGRFSNAMNAGELEEVEPVDAEMVVNTDALVDAIKWKHALPREVK